MIRKNLLNDSNNNNGTQLSNDDLWNMANIRTPITRQDINIQTPFSKDGLQNLSEGFDLLEN